MEGFVYECNMPTDVLGVYGWVGGDGGGGADGCQGV